MRVFERALICVAAAAASAMALFANAPAQTAPGNIYELIDAPGVELVQQECGSCHGIMQITTSGGHDRYEWERLMRTMVALDDAKFDQILDYLTLHYPPGDPNAPPPPLEPLTVAFREWPSASGQRMSAPVQAADGAVWWVSTRADLIGRRDPMTRRMQEWPLPRGARPLRVAIDGQGGVWYVGETSIGKFDPATGQSEAHALADRRAHGATAAAFDAAGNLWFTVEDANTIGRFDPRTSEVRLVAPGSGRVAPRGLALGRNGALWVGCAASNCLIHVDAETMDLREIRLPDARSTAPSIGLDRDGVVWYVDAELGALGRYTPDTNAFEQWSSPGGANARPSGLVVIQRDVWFSETRGRSLVRFSARAKAFQTWPLPAGASLSGLAATAAGNVLLQSEDGADRIILAEPTRAQ